MGWFNPIKGAYPSLGQVDKTLPVAEGNDEIERGFIITPVPDSVTSDDFKSEGGVWKIADGSEDMFYVALQDYGDYAAGFAGTAFMEGTQGAPNRPAITGIDLNQDGEYETSVFDDGNYIVGDKLTVSNGKLTKAEEGSKANIVGIVTQPPYERWVNNKVAKPAGAVPRLATRTGDRELVIRFKTA